MNVVIWWAVFTGGVLNTAIDARPIGQFSSMQECRAAVSAYEQTDSYKVRKAELESLRANVTSLCLPAGVRP